MFYALHQMYLTRGQLQVQNSSCVLEAGSVDPLVVTPPAKPPKAAPIVTPFSKIQLAAAKRQEAADKTSKKDKKSKMAPKETCATES